MPDADFEKRANQQLGTEAKMEAALNKYADS